MVLVEQWSINFAVGSGGGWWCNSKLMDVMLVDSQIGNSWTPVNFGGSTDITKATGALPILNTINGGNVARPGVFGSDVSKNLQSLLELMILQPGTNLME